MRFRRLLTLGGAIIGLGAGFTVPAPATTTEIMPMNELEAGMTGEVWTVFKGQTPESFEVEIAGIIQNALGPGKSMIICQLTDPRVQHMGAVAGMSGSPLYIEDRFAGALSYQVQRFETVRFAGFTPAADLLEVRTIALNGKQGPTGPAARTEDDPVVTAGDDMLTPLTPVFSWGGLSPHVLAVAAHPLDALGIQVNGLGGSSPDDGNDASNDRLRPGQAVGAALAVGDITLAGTGTVSQVDGDRVLAFGHPLLGLGEVAMPMTAAEIVTILPSSLTSTKIANTGAVIGTVRQDRLSAIYGEMGPGPPMVPVTVKTPYRTLNFATVRHPRITPMITTIGLSQAILGSNDAGLAEGFAVTTKVKFGEGEILEMAQLYAGPRSFRDGLAGLTASLTTWLQNPVEKAFPEKIEFTVVPLPVNPSTSLDNVRLSHRVITSDEFLQVLISLRDFQSQSWTETVELPISPDWRGKKLEVVVTDGPTLDMMSGGQQSYPVSQIRNFSAYLDVLRNQRPPDGLHVAIVTLSEVFLDQTQSTLELPASLARVARKADRSRFNQRPTREILWESHILPDRLVPGIFRLPLIVTD